ncbi:magnesium and cobalt transporter [Sulfurivirga caldicuralii]|uniref:Magnesium and cobalt efflux protein CorC n=1 Tax=Sulfurivirga caldicuralii TaxID=364032 RepID=A0A1N6GFH6_9GAMM|nr:transporter associated domain-containing protein [Sulfurivirga caldicuralii]SIO06244.1 magnesium and cobalt transporter [Sulfurivirga caldicuralii]
MDAEQTSSWFDKVKHLFNDEPESREDLLEILREAAKRGLIETDAERMIERVLYVSDLRVRDVMIPRSKMVYIEDEAPLEESLQRIVEEGHSRYPVLNEERTEVLGILMSKDVLRALIAGELEDNEALRKLYRKPVFVPESKRLNVMLREFKSGRTHLALVVDEYAELSGLITIEDVLEEIVGEIEDEHDEGAQLVKKRKGFFEVDATMPLEDFNRYFDTHYECPGVETIGGCVISRLGHIPEAGEQLALDGLTLEVLKSDGRRVQTMIVRKVKDEATEAADAADPSGD